MYKKIITLALLCMINSIQAAKIIALLQIRNEQEVVEHCLRALSLYADSIIVLDDASNDQTPTIVKNLMGELPIEELIVNTVSAWQNGSEKDNREKLLIAGRQKKGTHFIMLDADEIFSAHCMHNNWLRNKILNLKSGQTLRLPTIHQWNNLYQYRNDEQCNPSMYKWRRVYAFADDGVSSYLNNNSAHGSACIHVSREPENMICNEPVNSFFYNTVECGVLHFKCVSLSNIAIKKAWYMCLEFIRLNENSTHENDRLFNAQHINSVYNNFLYHGILSEIDNVICSEIPASWYNYSFFNGAVYEEPLNSRIQEIDAWINKYGFDYFKNLDIWQLDCMRKFTNNQ